MVNKDENINFHSFAPRGKKNDKKRFLLYGFDRDHPLDRITDELTRRLNGFKKAEVEHLLMTYAPAVAVITDSQLQAHHRVYFTSYTTYR